MIKNYFKIAWRNLWKNKFTSFINIFGLGISISIALLIALFIHDEINYDTFEKDYDRIFRVEQDFTADGKTRHWASTPAPLVEFIAAKFPEVESGARLYPITPTFVKTGETKIKEEDCFLSDSSVFETLGLSLIEGNPATALTSPNSVVLPEKTARLLFGRRDPMDQFVLVNSRMCKVTGILKDLPSSSHLKINLLGSINQLDKSNPDVFGWIANGYYTYIKLKKNTDVKLLMDKAAQALYTDGIFQKPAIYYHNFHAISDIHLGGNIEKELSPNSSRLYIYIFMTIAALIILLASINYINLTTSRSLQRTREIGVRKTFGAAKKNVIIQFLSESVLITLVSFVLSFLIVLLALPYFNSVTGKTLSVSDLFSPFFFFASAALILFIGFLAGIYPSFVISSFDPINALKGIPNKPHHKKFSFGFRKSLVIFQFVVSAFLVISSVVVMNQITYMFDKPLGYSKENTLIVPALSLNREKIERLRNELKTDRGVIDVSATSATPGKRVFLKGLIFEGRPIETTRTMCIDADYMRTMKIELVQGRDFDRTVAGDSVEDVILNEAAVSYFGLKKDAIGTTFQIFGFPPGPQPYRVIGVVKDFHQGSLHTAIEPMVFINKEIYNYVLIRYDGNEATAKHINKVWSGLFPDQLFTYTLLDEAVENLYKAESTLKKLLVVFTSLAIAIASMGLFGLIFFSNTLRKKEIGIRKVLGAANSSIIYLLSREYVVLIFISLLISLPLSGYLTRQWLNNFAYHTSVSVSTFVIGVAVTLVIALATVFVQGMKAALDNPVKNIKAE
jgi:putative ABC transport system permease protein